MATTFEIFFFGLVSFVWQDDEYLNVEIIDDPDGEHFPFYYLGEPHNEFGKINHYFEIKLPSGPVSPHEQYTGDILHLSEVAYRLNGLPVQMKQNRPLVKTVPMPKGEFTVADYYPYLGWRTRPGAQPARIPRINTLQTTVDTDVVVVVDNATTKTVYQSSFIVIGNMGMKHDHSHFPKHRLLTNGDAIDDLIQTTQSTSPDGESGVDNISDARSVLKEAAEKYMAQMPAHGHKNPVHYIYTQVDCSSSQWP